jgi:predicted metal-dependent peptidase
MTEKRNHMKFKKIKKEQIPYTEEMMSAPCPTMTEQELRLAKQQLDAARYVAASYLPYLSNIFYALKPVVSRKAKTVLSVDRHWRLYYRPDMILAHVRQNNKKTVPSELVGIFISAALCCALRYAERAALLSPSKQHLMLVNLCQTMACKSNIEEFVKNSNEAAANSISMPKWIPSPRDFKLEEKKPWEYYYAQLKEEYEKLLNKSKDILDYIVNVLEGSGIDGADRDHEDSDESAHEGFADISEVSKVSDIEKDLVRKKTAEDIKSKNPGSIPKDMVVWADEELKPPKVKWYKELAAVLRGQLARGNSYQSYSRRPPMQSSFPDFFLPGMVTYSPRVGVVLDTSGSMCDGVQLTEVMSELKSILSQIPTQKVRVICCDASITPVAQSELCSVSKIKLVGGGGTDMTTGIEHFEKQRPRPDVVITLTDGYTKWPEKTSFRHIAILTQNDGSRPSFGKTIVIDNS